MSFRRGTPFLAVLVTLTLGVSAWATCAMGESMSQSEMACCVGQEHHDCAAAGTVERCCERPTRLEQALFSPSKIVQLSASSVGDAGLAPATLIIAGSAHAQRPAGSFAQPTPPLEHRHLLLSVFRI